tara:strand:+ start:30 stop:563 length:534 start_codon:yes stop_codon:yes gene_type:complete
MKTSKIKAPLLLKTILDILLILLILGTIFFIIFISVFIWIPQESIPFRIHEDLIESLNTQAYIILGFVILSRIIFIYTVIKFKHLVRLFFQGNFFSIAQIKIIRVIGKSIIIVAILNTLPSFIHKTFFEESPRTVTYGQVASIDSFWFIIAVGLFFIFLGRIFDNARILKEENELTV